MESIQSSTQSTYEPAQIARSWRMAEADRASSVQEDSTLGFGDLLDLINPLQHIPVVGSIYRAMTGDEIKPAVQVAGDLLYGAVTGSVLLSGVASIASMTYEQENGEEPTIQLADALFGDETVQPPAPEAGAIQLAEKEEILADETLLAFQEEAPLDQAPAPESQEIQLADATLSEVFSSLKESKSSVEDETESVNAPVLAEMTVVSEKKLARATSGVRLGNTIYTGLSPQAAKVAVTEAPQETKAAKIDDQTLGLMIHEQAQARQAGNALPPELVRDMMLMALDKYKTAQTTTEPQTAVQ